MKNNSFGLDKCLLVVALFILRSLGYRRDEVADTAARADEEDRPVRVCVCVCVKGGVGA